MQVSDPVPPSHRARVDLGAAQRAGSANRPPPPLRAPIAALADNLGLLDPDTEETAPTAIPHAFRFDADDWELEDDDAPAAVAPRPSRPAPAEPVVSAELPPLPRCFPSVAVSDRWSVAAEPEAEPEPTAPTPEAHGPPVATWLWLVIGLLLGADLALLIGR